GRIDLPCQGFVRTGLAVRYAQQLVPYALLKRSARINQGHRKLLQIPGEILPEFLLENIQMLVATGHDRAREQLLQCEKLVFEHSPVGKFQKAYAQMVRCGDQRSQGTLKPRDNDTVEVFAAAGRFTEGARERVPESTVRFVAVPQRDI